MLHLDYETFGEVELGNRSKEGVGLHNYCCHPGTGILCLGWAIDNEEPQIWLPGQDLPERLYWAFMMDEIAAFNSPFERNITRFKMPKYFPDYGWNIPADRFQDPQASARYLSLPANLEDVGMVLGLPLEMQKDKRGEELLEIFSYPKTRKKKDGGGTYFIKPTDLPVEFAALQEYCKRDIIAEREVARRLELLKVYPLPQRERRIWIFDQKVNDRGMPVDRQFVEKALKLAERDKQDKLAEQNKLTGLENANSTTQLLPWVQARGYSLNNLRKQNVELVLKNSTSLTPECRKVLQGRLEAGSTSYKKLAAILRNISADGTIKNQFIYMGSSRCGRWSGNAVQFHNLARPGVINKGTEWEADFEDMKIVKQAREMVYNEDYEGMRKRFLSPLMVIKNLIRTVFVAP